MWRLGIAALAAMALGCDPDCPPVFSYEGSASGFDDAVAAAAEWQTCGITIDVSRDGGHIPLRETDDPLGPGDPEYEGSKANARTTVRGGEVVSIVFRRGAGRIVLAHEFGHALGLGHLQKGVMAHASVRRGDERVTSYECDALAACEYCDRYY